MALVICDPPSEEKENLFLQTIVAIRENFLLKSVTDIDVLIGSELSRSKS